MRRQAPGYGRDQFVELGRVVRCLTGRDATRQEQQRFKRYLDLLLVWNRVHRMTGLASPTEIIRELFQDSLLFLPLLPKGPLALVDIGAGAGIPGVPLRIVRPEIALTLVESRRKPVSFLASLKRELGLSDMEVLEGRAEVLTVEVQRLVGSFDVVVSRSVGSLPELIPTAMEYLKNGGVFIASGPPLRKPMPVVPEGFEARWETVSVGEAARDRTFLLVSKEEVA